VLGPDPASSGVATIGGVVANNASGMTAGTKLNSYHTVASMKVLLPSGTLIDTGDREVDGELFAHERELHEGLLEIREEILRDEVFAAWIKKKSLSRTPMDTGWTHSSTAVLLARFCRS
jgi:D-lactate dehydrogenase